MAEVKKRKALELSEGKTCRTIKIKSTTSIKGDRYEAGEEIALYTDLAAACIFQGIATYVEEAPAKKK